LRLFYFILKAGHRSIPDNDGVELPNETAAGRHALLVARELMRNRERRTFRWQIQVCDDYMLPLFSVLFFEADESFRMFPRELRRSMRRAALTAGAFDDALAQTQNTLNEVRATLARADRVLQPILRPVPF